MPAVFRPSPTVQSFGSGIRFRYCGPTQTGSIRVRNGSFTSLKRLNEFKNNGVPVAGSVLSTLPCRLTDDVVENAFPFRRLVPPALPGAPGLLARLSDILGAEFRANAVEVRGVGESLNGVTVLAVRPAEVDVRFNGQVVKLAKPREN